MTDLQFCFNKLSCAARDQIEAYDLLYAALDGVRLIANATQIYDNISIYYDSDLPGSIILSLDGFTIGDFYDTLEDNDPDFASFFVDIVQKAPFSLYLSAEERYKCVSCDYSVNGHHVDIDLLKAALLFDFYILSLGTDRWQSNKIPCHKDRAPILYIRNIFDVNSADEHVNNVDFIPRSFQIYDGRVFIYFNDHPPPHAHFFNTESNCRFLINDGAGLQLLSGDINPAARRELAIFINNNMRILRRAWEHYCPRRH